MSARNFGGPVHIGRFFGTMEEERKNAAGEQAEEITQTVENQRKAEAKARRKNEKKAAKAA